MILEVSLVVHHPASHSFQYHIGPSVDGVDGGDEGSTSHNGVPFRPFLYFYKLTGKKRKKGNRTLHFDLPSLGD